MILELRRRERDVVTLRGSNLLSILTYRTWFGIFDGRSIPLAMCVRIRPTTKDFQRVSPKLPRYAMVPIP